MRMWLCSLIVGVATVWAGTPTDIDADSQGVTEVRVGGMHGMNVRVAEVGMWNIDLADGAYTADVAGLEQGFSPARIRPQNLIAYWPLVRGLQDVRGGHTLTATNSPVVVEHPRVLA